MSTPAIVTYLMIFSTCLQLAESGIGSSNIPACVITTRFPYETPLCPSPLYTSCGFGVCCSPHHYCCNYKDYTNSGYYAGVACCRRSGFTFTARSGEIASVVLGTIAWAGVVCVVGFITCPRIYYAINRMY
ncbi:hypothetical protein CHS0354_022357 [Potamilus streckersoni]|uniref:Cysteine rich secreted protein n=1 Tax=Potamilus streckersoni TaxID=2493646 RepID=A0AAE0W5Q3_9BIVA|nr:hypothetical protein CHS0354_022357 [Potamilus streckersoni]